MTPTDTRYSCVSICVSCALGNALLFTVRIVPIELVSLSRRKLPQENEHQEQITILLLRLLAFRSHHVSLFTHFIASIYSLYLFVSVSVCLLNKYSIGLGLHSNRNAMLHLKTI